MSFRRNRALKVKTVVLTGMSDKSQIFQAAFSLFPSLNTDSDQISGDISGDENDVDQFFYEGKPPHQEVQIQLKDILSIDSPRYMDLSTEYRSAHCIILVYDPTVESSLMTMCEHYEHTIFNMNLNARIILIRNNANTYDDKVLLSKLSEKRTLESTRAGRLLSNALTQNYGDTDFSLIYDLLTPGVTDSASRFFLKELFEVLDGYTEHSTAQINTCRRRRYFCCCSRTNDDEDEPFVHA